MTEMASFVVYAADPAAAAGFYRALGLDLADEDHDEGPVHLATEIGPVHFAIYQADVPGRAPERRAAGGSFAGFYVASLDRAAEAVRLAGAPTLTPHEVMPWGCRIVVADPDGRPVEINQRDHCPGP